MALQIVTRTKTGNMWSSLPREDCGMESFAFFRAIIIAQVIEIAFLGAACVTVFAILSWL